MVAILAPALVLVAITVMPIVMNLSGSTATENGIFITGFGALVIGLVGLGFAPRRTSSVYRDRVGQYRSPSITGGTVALSILFAGLILIAIGAVMSSV
jgi:hypothetical protein